MRQLRVLILLLVTGLVISACATPGSSLPAPSISITSVSPAVLRPGDTVTISGSGFYALANGSVPTIGVCGLTLPATLLDSVSQSIVLPPAGSVTVQAAASITAVIPATGFVPEAAGLTVTRPGGTAAQYQGAVVCEAITAVEGDLVITVTPEHEDFPIDVTVTGPDFQQQVTDRAGLALQDLTPGEYTITPAALSSPDERYAMSAGAPITVNLDGNAPQLVSVDYKLLDGTLDIVFPGLPEGQRAPLLLTQTSTHFAFDLVDPVPTDLTKTDSGRFELYLPPGDFDAVFEGFRRVVSDGIQLNDEETADAYELYVPEKANPVELGVVSRELLQMEAPYEFVPGRLELNISIADDSIESVSVTLRNEAGVLQGFTEPGNYALDVPLGWYEVIAEAPPGMMARFGDGGTGVLVDRSHGYDDSDTPAISVVFGGTAVDIEQGNQELPLAATAQLTALIASWPAMGADLIWASSDTEVVTVDSDGLVTAMGMGNTVITATNRFDAAESDSIEVTVVPGFAMTIDTTHISGTEFVLPLRAGATTIWWGDGTESESFAAGVEPSHVFAKDGSYTISVRADDSAPGASFGSASWDSYSPALVSVLSWGDIDFVDLSSAFHGAVNLTGVPDYLPENVELLSAMFSGATSFNQDIGSWDTSRVTSIERIFQDARSFNQNLTGWCLQSVTDPEASFDDGATAWLPGLKPTGLREPCNFVLDIDLRLDGVAGTEFELPLKVTGSVTIDWGDGSEPVILTDNDDYPSHDYGSKSAYTIAVTREVVGTATLGKATDRGSGLDYNNSAAVVGVESWGSTLGFTSFQYSFRRAINLDYLPEILPSTVTSLRGMFSWSKEFDYDIGAWDTSHVTDMSILFFDTKFNQDISGWDTSNVVSMTDMFNAARVFNQDISGWDTSNVVTMISMFAYADAFKADITGWDTSKVESMRGMFVNNDTFNQTIGEWDVSSVKDMSGMFTGARAFNQDLSGWDTSNVTDMSTMFWRADAFNQPLDKWDVSAVVDMSTMFSIALAFNQDLSGWCVSQFTEAPSYFDEGATSWTNPAYRPNWGTCPSPTPPPAP